MPVEICTVSGYTSFGKNMTAVKYGNEAVIIDMGIHPENYIRYTEDEENLALIKEETLVRVGAIPDVSIVDDWNDMIIAIVPGHAHLDHCGAIAYLAGNFRAPVVCTPFTAEVIRSIIKDREIAFRNRISTVQPNGTKKISKNIQIEFIHTTHSTPQASMIAIHTPEGIVLYACDFKFDKTPTFGEPPNIERLKELGNEKVLALIMESTYGSKPGQTPSELVAREMLEESIEKADSRKNAIVVTTFSSHIARLKSILELGKKHQRKVVFLGRSMSKYISAAEKAGIVKISDKADIVKYGSKIEKKLKEIEKLGKHKHLLVTTGHQGEPKSVLSRIITKNFLDAKDWVIFSCKTIPTPTNRANRERLERELNRLGIHMLIDIHQSGHGAQDELLELVRYTKPQNVIPSHGDPEAKKSLAKFLEKNDFQNSKIHIAKDGDRITL